MTKKILVAAIALCAVALTAAGPAQAGDGGRSTITMSLVPDPFASVSCPEPEFGFGLNAFDLADRPLGTARTCIRSIDGCDPFVPSCRQTVRATLTLDLPRGSLTVPMKLVEVLPTELSFTQAGRGKVRAGTGAYAVAKGTVEGGGAGAFDAEFNFTGRLVYVAELRGVR